MTSLLSDLTLPQDLKELLKGSQYAFFAGKGTFVTCLEASQSPFKPQQKYSIYQIPAIIRLLGKKLNLFTSDLTHSLQGKSENIAIVLNWEEEANAFLVIKLNGHLAQALKQFFSQRSKSQWLRDHFGMNEKKHKRRQLPRYDIWSLKCTIKFPFGNESQFKVKTLSLTGIQVWSQSMLSLNHFHQVELHLPKKDPLKLNVLQLWQTKLQTSEGNFQYKSGYQLKFYNESEFKKYMAFIYALDQIKRKNVT